MRLPRWLVRFGFRLLYNELAWTYDRVSRAVSLGQWRQWQRAVIPRLSGQRVLEIAFGTGDLLVDMTAVGYRPYGLDLSPYMVRLARAKLARKGMAAPLCQGRVQALPFANGLFDSVAITFPTDFICQPSALAEIGRVLAPGGRLVANGVTLEAEQRLLSFRNEFGGDLTRMAVSRAAPVGPVGRLQTFQPLKQVTQLVTIKK